MQQLIDTHCHLHDSDFFTELAQAEAYHESYKAGVIMFCVGTSVKSSQQAIDFCAKHNDCYPIIGIHPHGANTEDPNQILELVKKYKNQIIGIGEIGLDYFYNHSSKDDQLRVLRAQLKIATDYNLPVSFHVRDAFTDFWRVLDEFEGVRGVLHSFTDTEDNLRQALNRGLYIGINGISMFTKNEKQQNLYKNLDLNKILLETDAPFLTPPPFRGKMNIPAYVELVAKNQAELKQVSLADVKQITTVNVKRIFKLN